MLSTGQIISRDKWALLLLLAVVGFMTIFPIWNADIFWHLANGREMVNAGRIVNEELFSFTVQGKPFANHEFLSQIIFYLVFEGFGANGLILFKAAVAGLTALILYNLSRQFGATASVATVLLILVFLIGVDRWTVRPQIFSFLLLALLQWLLFSFLAGKVGRVYLLAIPVLLALWDTLHAGIFGYILLTSTVFAETVKSLAASRSPLPSVFPPLDRRRLTLLWTLLLFAVAVSLASPYGLRNYGNLLDILAARQPGGMFFSITEFQPTDFARNKLFVVLVGLVVASCLRCYRRIDLTMMAVALPFLVMALRFGRATALFALVAVPLLSSMVPSAQQRGRERSGRGGEYGTSPLLQRVPRRDQLSRWLLLVAALTMLVYLVDLKLFRPGGYQAFGLGLREANHPVGAVRFIRETGLSGRMFNEGHYGGYLAFYLYPQHKIFRYNLPAAFDDVHAAMGNPGFPESYGISYAIAVPETWRFVFPAEQWAPVYWQEEYVLAVKRIPENRPIISRYELKYYRPFIEPDALEKLRRASPASLAGLTRELGQVLRFESNRARSRLLAVLVLEQENRLPIPERLGLLEQALRFNSGAPDLYNAIGQLHFRSGQAGPAEAALRKSIELGGRAAMTHLALGFIVMDRGELASAEEEFLRAVKLDEEFDYPYYGLGMLYEKQGKIDQAIGMWQRFLEMTPEGPWAEKARQKIVEMEGRVEGRLNR